MLRDSGYLTSRRGSGSVATLPAAAPAARGRVALPGRRRRGRHRPHLCRDPGAGRHASRPTSGPLGQLPRYLAGAGYLTLGVPELREVIADRYTARGLPTSADEVLVTSGAVAGIGVVLRALLGHGDRVVVETPTYPNTVDALRRGGARLVPLAMDPDGWDVDRVRPHRAVRGGRRRRC